MNARVESMGKVGSHPLREPRAGLRPTGVGPWRTGPGALAAGCHGRGGSGLRSLLRVGLSLRSGAHEEAIPPGRIQFAAESSLSLLSERNLERLQKNGVKALLPGVESWFDLI
jgi:hypothetical protein